MPPHPSDNSFRHHPTLLSCKEQSDIYLVKASTLKTVITDATEKHQAVTTAYTEHSESMDTVTTAIEDFLARVKSRPGKSILDLDTEAENSIKRVSSFSAQTNPLSMGSVATETADFTKGISCLNEAKELREKRLKRLKTVLREFSSLASDVRSGKVYCRADTSDEGGVVVETADTRTGNGASN